MGKVRRIILTVFFLIILLPLGASTIQYSYRGLLSSTDLEDPSRGTVYKDDNGSIYIVSRTHKEASILERIYTYGVPAAGTPLTKRSALKMIDAVTNLNNIGVRFSFTCSLYPFRPAVEAGYSIRSRKPYVMAGLAVEIPLSKVFRSDFTLVEDGSVQCHVLGGVTISNTVKSHLNWGICYRYGIGKVVIGVGYSDGVMISAGVRL